MRSNRIDRNSSYRDLMHILPYVDGRNASRKELAAIKVLTFENPISQSNLLGSRNDNGFLLSDPTESLLAPFRSDYDNTNADGHIRVSRIVRRRTVVISDGFSHPRSHLHAQRGANVRQRKRRKQKKINPLITLPCVIESIRPSPPSVANEESSSNTSSLIKSESDYYLENINNTDSLVIDTEDPPQETVSTENSQKIEAPLTDDVIQEGIDPNMAVSDIDNIDDEGRVEGNEEVEKQESRSAGGSDSDLRLSMSEETNVISNKTYNVTPSVEDQSVASHETGSATDTPNNAMHLVQGCGEASCAFVSTGKPDIANEVEDKDERPCPSPFPGKTNDEANSAEDSPTSTVKVNDEVNSAEDQDVESYKSTSDNHNVKEERDDKEGRSHNVTRNIVNSEGLVVSSTKDVPGKDKLDFAAEERGSTYTGLSQYSNLNVRRYIELYFSLFVFPSLSSDDSVGTSQDFESIKLMPRIQMYQTDRDLMMWMISKSKDETSIVINYDSVLEKPKYVSCEEILPCGIAATARILPRETDLRDFQSNVAYKEGKPIQMSDNQSLLLCISNAAVYFCPNIETGGSKGKKSFTSRQFPSPIPAHAEFHDALWPHAYCRHPLKFLRKVSFDGFGFQRLTLHFKLPGLRDEVYMQPENGLMSAFEYTYVIFSCNQHRTIKILQELQAAVKESSSDDSQELCVENDDSAVLRAISRALGPKNVCDDILHYQVLRQMWPHQKESVRRALILTDDYIFLFDENYVGDGYSHTLNHDGADQQKIGDVVLRTMASTLLRDVLEIFAADKDPRLVILSIKAQYRLQRPQVWRLLCRDRENAEKLVDTVRKVIGPYRIEQKK